MAGAFQQQPGFAQQQPNFPPQHSGVQVTCGKCNARQPGGKFCAECGAPLAQPKKFCVSCGGELAAGAKFCPGCGTAAGAPAPAAPDAPQT
jgi:predicted amidophosphoribosyltransferase